MKRPRTHCVHNAYQRNCKICIAAYQQVYRQKYKAEKIAYNKAYRESHRAELILYTQQWRAANPTYYRKRQKTQPERFRLATMARKAGKLQRTPKWLSAAHKQQIKIFYGAAASLTKEFGVEMQVDHIVPLKGKNVSGLHVPWNLQVISKSENCKKSNRLICDE